MTVAGGVVVDPDISVPKSAEILESIDEAFYALDRDWRFVYVNRRAEVLWGRRREELLGHSAEKVFPNWPGSESHKAHQHALEQGRPVRVETVSTVIGVPVELNIHPGPSGLSVYFRDVSERQRMERALRERDETLTLAERSAGIGVWDVDLATGMARGTPQFFRIMGLAPTSDPVPIETFRALRYPEDRERVVGGFRETLASGTDAYETEYRILRPDGQTRWIFGRGRVIRDRDGKPVRYSGVDLDITERKRAEAALAESEERLRLAQDAAGIGIWDWDIATSEIRWTEHQWRLHGLDPRPGMIRYDDWKSLIHPEDRDRASAAVTDAVAAKAAYDAEYRVAGPDGGERWLAARGTVLVDEVGRPSRLIGVTVDVTERRQAAEALARINQELERRVRDRTVELEAEAARRVEAEGRLHQVQKMEAVGQLTGGMAHDFNNLLTVIIGNLDTLKRRLADEQERAERLTRPVEMAMQGAQTAAQLTHRLLAFSRRQPLEPEVLEPNKLVAGMSDMISRTLRETIQVETVLAAGLWHAFADPNQLESALLNLVVNASDAMPGGGRLTIETANTHFDEAYAATTDDLTAGQYVMLCVSDTGSGIAPDLLSKVFEPFFTTKDTGKGSGLGLSMVYGFVKQSGGHVRVYSEVGLGTSVKLYLPRVVDIPKESAAGAAAHPVPGEALARARPGETILLVEDNADVRRYGVSALEDLGYRVLQAPDGQAALRLLDEAAPDRLDLLFTDVVLPGGMSGRVLADAVLQRHPGLPVLFTTGYTRNAIVHHDRLDPDVHLLGKPYTLDALSWKVRQLIDAHHNVIPFRSAGGSSS